MATRGLASTRRKRPTRFGQHLFGDFPVRNVLVCGLNTLLGAVGATPTA
jgi:hypothetical protein